jgi:putative addiction module component (TIGR02574 family)
MKLPPEERSQLATKIIESLQYEALTDVEKAWLPIIEKRHSDFLAGKSHMLSLDEVVKNVNEEFGWRKSI